MAKRAYMLSSRRSNKDHHGSINYATDRQQAMVIPGTFQHITHYGMDNSFDHSNNQRALHRQGVYTGHTDTHYRRNAFKNPSATIHPQYSQYAQYAYADNNKLHPVSSRQVYRQLSRAPTPVDTNILRNTYSNHSEYDVPVQRVLSRRPATHTKYIPSTKSKSKSGQSKTFKRRITLFWKRLTRNMRRDDHDVGRLSRSMPEGFQVVDPASISRRRRVRFEGLSYDRDSKRFTWGSMEGYLNLRD